MADTLRNLFASDVRAFRDVDYFIKEKLDIDWLYPKQKEIIVEFYNPEKQYNELIVVAGMRSGKTTLASIPSCYEVYKLILLGRPCAYYGLAKGSEIFIINVAVSQQQSRDTVFAQIKARIDNSPWFQNQDMKERWNEFVFPVDDGKVIIRSEHSNSASLVGKSAKLVVFDEIARFTDTGGKSSGQMVYDSLTRAVKTFKQEGRKISVSSPMYIDDFQMQLYRAGLKLENVLTYHLATWEMNPVLTKEDLWDEFEKNPEAAWRDYGAMPSSSLETYFKEPWRIDDCVDKKMVNVADTYDLKEKIFKIKREEKAAYFLAGDPALKNDAFGLAMIHRDTMTGRIVVDLLHRFSPDIEEEREVDAEKLKEYIIALANAFPIYSFVTDTWQFPETIQAIRRAGVNVEQHHVKKMDYDYLKELIYTKQIVLPYHEKLMEELKMLELRSGTRVDHPRGGSNDVADALANACYLERNLVGVSEAPVAITFEV